MSRSCEYARTANVVFASHHFICRSGLRNRKGGKGGGGGASLAGNPEE